MVWLVQMMMAVGMDGKWFSCTLETLLYTAQRCSSRRMAAPNQIIPRRDATGMFHPDLDNKFTAYRMES
jgi:hypothetical protein